MLNILYILSGNLSTTPRALQLAIKAKEKGYNIKIIAINRNETWNKLDRIIADKNGIECQTISIDKSNIRRWFHSTFINKLANALVIFLKKNRTIAAYANAKENYLLWIKLKKESNFDVVTGFSAHSLFPIWKYSQKYKIPFVFDRFWQCDSTSTKKYKGVGLGLSISKSIVEMLNGEIWVESVIDEGTTFYIKIPLEEIK